MVNQSKEIWLISNFIFCWHVFRNVVIVGGGLAGLSCALEARNMGASVVLLEQESHLGGNSAKASSGINGAESRHQFEQNISDSVEAFAEDTYRSGRGKEQKELVKILAKDSAEAIDFLEKEGKLDLSIISLLGGQSAPRAHRAKISGRPMNVGLAITSAMEKAARDKGVDIRTEAKATSLMRNDRGEVIGVSYEDKSGQPMQVLGNVVLSTGGYSTDREGLLAEFNGKLSDLPSTNGEWKSVGEGIRMSRRIGAKLALMEHVQVHPTGLVDPKNPDAKFVILAGEALRGNGGIFLNAKGKRFVDELGYRDVVSNAIFKHGSKLKLESGKSTPTAVFLVLNEAAVSKFKEAIMFYSFKKLVFQFDNLKAFCDKFSVPYDTAKSTLHEYNEDAKKGKDAFGKTTFNSVPVREDEHLTVMIVTPSVHYTMGGLQINEETNVLHKSGSVINGLFAAGEVTGGLHGENRLGGNSLLECVVFGRIAGKQAAKY